MASAQQIAQDVNFSSGNLGHGIMSSLFGDSWASMYETGPNSAVGPLLQNIFQLYNLTVAMAAGAIIVYFIWSGTMQTAHEGKFLGKRYSSIWSIIRCVVGGASIVPIFGMSLVQMLVLSFAGLGFQTADRIAVMTAEYLSTGRPLTTFPAFYDEKKDKALLAIMQMEVCKAYKEKLVSSDMWDASVPIIWDGNKVQYGKSAPLFGSSEGSCGTLSLDTHYYQVARYAIEDVSKTLRAPAEAIVAAQKGDPAAIGEARKRLKQLDKELTDVARIDIDKETQAAIANFSQSVSIKGWMTLGTWYYTLSEQTARFNQRVSYDFTFDSPDYSDAIDTGLMGISEYIVRGARYAQDAGVAVSSVSGAETMQEITDAVFSILEGGGDPYLRLINLGHYAVQTAAVLTGVSRPTNSDLSNERAVRHTQKGRPKAAIFWRCKTPGMEVRVRPMEAHGPHVEIENSYSPPGISAMASISIRPFKGSFATAKALRAGAGVGKKSA